MRQARAAQDRGFTVVELMVVVGILAILVSVAVASYMLASERAYRISCISNQRIYFGAAQQYALTHNTQYPPDLQTLNTQGYVKSSLKAHCPKGANVPYTYDPATGAVACPLHPFSP